MADRLTSHELDRIRAVAATWTARVVAQDFEGAVALYTNDTVVMPPNHPVVRGREAVLAFMRRFPRVMRAELHYDEIDGYDDLAYASGRYSMTLQPDGAPGPVEDQGVFLEVRRKQPDGSWPLSHDIFHSILPAAGGSKR